MIRRPPRSTRTDTTLSLHDALPSYESSNGGSEGSAGGALSTGRPAKGSLGGCGGQQTSRPRRTPDPASNFELTAQIRLMRSEEHTSELQSLMRISYAFFCLKNTRYD